MAKTSLTLAIFASLRETRIIRRLLRFPRPAFGRNQINSRGDAEKKAIAIGSTPASLRLCAKQNSSFHKDLHRPVGAIWKCLSVVVGL